MLTAVNVLPLLTIEMSRLDILSSEVYTIHNPLPVHPLHSYDLLDFNRKTVSFTTIKNYPANVSASIVPFNEIFISNLFSDQQTVIANGRQLDKSRSRIFESGYDGFLELFFRWEIKPVEHAEDQLIVLREMISVQVEKMPRKNSSLANQHILYVMGGQDTFLLD